MLIEIFSSTVIRLFIFHALLIILIGSMVIRDISVKYNVFGGRCHFLNGEMYDFLITREYQSYLVFSEIFE